MPFLLMAATSSGCSTATVATVEPICAEIKVVCPSNSDEFTEETATMVLQNNKAGAAGCGNKWAQCPKLIKRKPGAVKPLRSKPAAPVSKPRQPATPLRPTYADEAEPKMI